MLLNNDNAEHPTLSNPLLLILDDLGTQWTPWIRSVSSSAVVACSRWRHSGKSQKFKIWFSDGSRAVAKLIHYDERGVLVKQPQPKEHEFTLSSRHWSQWLPRFDDEEYLEASAHRSGGYEQGWGEALGFAVIASLGLKRKPPVMIRAIQNRILYASDYGWFGRLIRSFLPSYQVLVALTPWISDFRVQAPSADVLTHLFHPTRIRHLNATLREEVAQLSDVLVADFLIDDHDRKYAHNWVTTAELGWLQWDNGLSFKHTPFGVCGQLLCSEGPQCDALCAFRNDTLNTVREAVRTGKFEQRLYVFLKEFAKHGLAFEGMPFIVRATTKNMEKIHSLMVFETKHFVRGIQGRVSFLEKQVQDCFQHWSNRDTLL